jgi:hypothetical protein
VPCLLHGMPCLIQCCVGYGAAGCYGGGRHLYMHHVRWHSCRNDERMQNKAMAPPLVRTAMARMRVGGSSSP